ncbi:hypothetical protein Tco_1284924 [Tanacetum coccineum]
MNIMASRPRTRIPSRPRLGCDRLVSRAKVIENQVMAAPVISISSDTSDESVGSSIPRVILFGSIPIEVPVVPANLPVAPEVGAAAIASPAGVLELDTHSSSESGPSQVSLPPVPVAPMVSPFLCSDDSESDTELPERHVSFAPHDAMVARWRSRVASRPSSPSGSSSPTTSTSEIPIAPILPAPPTIVSPSTDIISPIDAPPGGFDCKEDSSSSDHSSSDHSSADHSLADDTLGHSTSNQSLSRHSSPSLPLGMRPRLWLRSPMSSTRFPYTAESSPSDSPAMLRFLALGWHLEEIHMTWAHLEKKRTRLRTYTKSLEESYS